PTPLTPGSFTATSRTICSTTSFIAAKCRRASGSFCVSTTWRTTSGRRTGTLASRRRYGTWCSGPGNGLIAPQGLAFKAYEIEELADVYFFRPIGWVVASIARIGGVSPNTVSVLAAVIGATGGLLLVKPSLGLLSFAVLVVHSIFDS